MFTTSTGKPGTSCAAPPAKWARAPRSCRRVHPAASTREPTLDNEEDPPLSWRQTRELFAADHARLRRALAAQLGAEPALTWLHPGAACVFLFRVAHHLWRRGHRKSARLVSQLGTLATGGDFHPASAFGPGLLVPHPTGVALMGGAGRNLAVMSRSGTGMLPKSRDAGVGMGLPFLGDDCTIGPCCGIEGP